MEQYPLRNLSADVDAFILRKRRKSPATIELYRQVLGRVLLPWCSAEGITETAELTTMNMERFIAHLESRTHRRAERPLTVATVRTYVRTVRTFLRWAEVPPGDYELPKQPVRLREVLSRQEVDTLERAVNHGKTAQAKVLEERDRLIVRVLADCGLRVGELLGLRAADLLEDGHHRQYFIRVIGKGDKQRDVPVSRELYFRLKRLSQRNPNGYIFEGKLDQLTRSGVNQMIRRLAKRAKIERRVWPHLFRHSFITQQLRAGRMQQTELRKVVGHSSLAMIDRIYSHMTAADSYEAMMEGLKQ